MFDIIAFERRSTRFPICPADDDQVFEILGGDVLARGPASKAPCSCMQERINLKSLPRKSIPRWSINMISYRGDTFVQRVARESRNANGKGKD